MTYNQDTHQEGSADATEEPYSFLQRQAVRMARWPKTHFWVAFLVSFGLGFIGIAFGDFSVSTEEGGWQSRGTLIADRQTQLLMVTEHEDRLFYGNEEDWTDLTTNIQPGWEEDYYDDENDDRRRHLSDREDIDVADAASKMSLSTKKTKHFNRKVGHHQKALRDFLQRRLQEDTTLDGCDKEWYTDGRMANETRLWPIWKVATKKDTALEPTILQELCEAEETTQRLLEDQGLCFGCEGSTSRKCLPPHGIVFYARMMVPNGMSLTCEVLAESWGPFQAATEAEWKTCVNYIESNPTESEENHARNCPEYFYPSLLDEFFDNTGKVEYTSSIFATTEKMVDDLYENVDQFGKGGNLIEGAYDTQDEDFVGLLAEGAVGVDMVLAMGSAIITTLAILIHTRSPFLMMMGLIQMILSFPLAFFVYRFLGQFDFFPFLNFIGVFVLFALGADHVFVAVDKWKNARNDMPLATTEQVAAKALPDAACAMFLTTSTTAVAFFGTAICPVAPVRLFAIFCGLLIAFDYVMDVLLLFPCLCIYDGYHKKRNCCMTCHCCAGAEGSPDEGSLELGNVDEDAGGEESKPVKTSLIRRILLGYYRGLHHGRWVLLALSTIAFVVCCVFAAQLELPTSSDVRVLRDSVEYEKNYQWRQNLLYEALEKLEGSEAYVIWGVIPADTGDQNDPASWSTLELDEEFDPSSQDAQIYLRDFCPRFFAEDFATKSQTEYECPINRFELWLVVQNSLEENAEGGYKEHCNGALALPMPSEDFHACFSQWSKLVQETTVLSRNNTIQTMYIPFQSRVRYDSHNEDLDKEWNLIENWMKADQETAPVTVNKAYFSSMDFWWYDTNQAMFQTAYGSAAIALAAAAIVILLSSRSLVMTLFSVLSIGYVLASVTAMMVAAGWTLGFLESICFAILMGVSVDFVIHFSHAYTTLQGEVSRQTRTKHALIDMGPSILAAGATTLGGATVMLFCVITFFTKFATVLFFTIIQATLGSFVVFLTLTDCIGPAEPTKLADQLIAKRCHKESANSALRKESNTGGSDDEDLEDREMTETARSTDVRVY